MTAERIASYINGLGFHTAHTDSNVQVTLGSSVPVTLDLDISQFGIEAKEFSDAASTFAAGLDEYSMYAFTLEERLGLNPSHISDLDLEDFMEIMSSGQLEQARKDVKETIVSAWKLARGAQELAQSPEFMQMVALPVQATTEFLVATA